MISPPPPDDHPGDRALERALIANFLIHGIALVGMALLLMPALPGGSGAPDAGRVAYVAAHPWRFRFGWLPWQLCAIADLWMAVALVRARWIPRPPAWIVLALTVAAVIPDQWAQATWTLRGPELAASDPAGYLLLEQRLFPLTAAWGAMFYTAAALGWTACFVLGRAWSRLLWALSFPLFGAMAVAVAGPLLPVAARPDPRVVAGANAVGFLALQAWLALVTEQVLRRDRPFTRYGRDARWRHPSPGAWGRLVDGVANSRLLRALFEWMAAPAMLSDITDVVYVNYLVPAERLEPLVPAGLELQRLGPGGRSALFTFLTFRHGHFGFRMLGPLRRLLPSPVQTNWRIHVRDPQSGQVGIHFLTNAIDNTLMALGARLLAEAMPMHVLRRASIGRDGSDPAGPFHLRLDPGEGSGPDCEAVLRPSQAPALEGAWRECWPDLRGFLAYCVPQDRAMSTQPLRHRVTRQEIELGIAIDDCQPLSGGVESRAAAAIAGEAAPICFRVAAVRFRFLSEIHRPLEP